ncbi:MAG: 2-oxoacid:ferredoxin oxidoreductase subunit beta [Chloroflexi bacterium]|nr:2-oxoacid:ferredoxin oxidoreductase subunit beta [Chloroflexota bacterium]
MAVTAPLAIKDFKADTHNNWCPGCGDFGILTAMQSALAQLGIPPYKVAVVSGIGCSGKTPHYVQSYGFHTLHGRSLPTATGVKLANKDLTVLAVGGDGDGYGIGAGYFVNTGRRNVDMTYIVMNNSVYGLTKGQASPTLGKGIKTKSMPMPAIQDGINPIALAIGAGYTFIARGYALDVKNLTGIIKAAIQHRGTSFVDVLQTCPTYNDLYTKEWYDKSAAGNSRLFRLEDTGYDGVVHDPTNADEVIQKKVQAVARSYEWGERIPVGIYYKIDVPTYEEQVASRQPALGQTPIVDLDHSGRDVTSLLEELR